MERCRHSLTEPGESAVGDAEEELWAQLSATVPQSVYVIPIVSTIVLTLAVAKLMDLANERGIAAGVKWALFLWAFVSLPFPVLHYAFAGHSPTLMVIDGGVELAGAVLTGVCLGALGFRTRAAPRAIAAPAAA
jgi:hypothetical protein